MEEADGHSESSGSLSDAFSNEGVVNGFDLYRRNARLSGKIMFLDEAATD